MTLNKPETFQLLKLSAYEDTILRQPIDSVQFPLSTEDQQVIHNMKYSIQPNQLKKANAPYESAAGMAANQWGINKRIFLFSPDGNTEEGPEVIINPSYEPIINSNTQQIEESIEWEACFSIPCATGKIKRYHQIRVTYQNEKGETIVKELEGWYARVWQHENDHLDGYLYDDQRTGKCLQKMVFSSYQELDHFYDEIRKNRKK